MKKILFAFLVFPQISFATISPPQSGLYRCVQGNNDSICDQKIKIRQSGNNVSSISVEYVGDCGSQGPYIYSCENESCSDGVIEINFQGINSYLWKNISYDINCKMQKLNL